jgi:hypothetical protein
MCILDQEEKQLKSLQKSEKIFGDIYRQIIENKADNYNSIKYYNILAALVVDSIRAVYDISSGSIQVDKRKSSYLKSAVTEYAAGQIAYGDVLLDYEKAFKQLYPLPTPTVAPSQPALITGPNTSAPSQIITSNNPLIQPDVVANSVKKMSYYEAMSPQIKAYFDQELNRFLKGFDTYAVKAPGFFSWTNVQLAVEGFTNTISKLFSGNFNILENLDQPSVDYNTKAILSCTFFKIDINKAIDFNTGLLASPVPFVIGYSYWTE